MLRIKNKNDMPCGLDVGYEICKTQSKLFLYAIRHNYDDNDFIKKYMESQFCNHKMDALYSRFQLMNAAYIMSYLLDEISPEASKKHYDEDAIEWTGWMYRYTQLRLEVPSKQIYETLPLNHMLIYYRGMGGEDTEYFIERMQTKFKR